MADVLYRKYRPTRFADVYGQSLVVDTLRYAFQNSLHAHGYLFAGPRGTGKTTIARLVAKAANCENFAKQNDVCNECEHCLSFDAGNYMDVFEIDAASNRGIDEIRQLRESVNFLPSKGKFKVYIIDEAHMLTKEAFNALLKTLEEPPAHVIFILATTEPEKLPQTIISRVQRFNFTYGNEEAVLGKLSKIREKEGWSGVSDAVLKAVFEVTDGSFRDAESLLGKMLTAGGEITAESVYVAAGWAGQNTVNVICGALWQRNYDLALENIDAAARNGHNLVILASQTASQIRHNLVSRAWDVNGYSVRLLNLLVDLQSQAKQIDDVHLLWHKLLFTLRLESPAEKKVASSSPIINPPVIKQGDSLSPGIQSVDELPPEPADIKSDTKREILPHHRCQLLETIKRHSSKLWAIVRTSQLELIEGMVQVVVTSRYGYELLSAAENAEIISQSALAVFGEGLQVEVVLRNAAPILETEDSNQVLVESIL